VENENILIFPNPSSGRFIVEMRNQRPETEITIRIMNSIGRKVYSSTDKASGSYWSPGLHSNKMKIDLDQAAGGVYLIEISSPGLVIERKKMLIIKQ
ncbi:MAG: T9SS type A sorting domain-containing protein, partial [Chitinophagales bacterium]